MGPWFCWKKYRGGEGWVDLNRGQVEVEVEVNRGTGGGRRHSNRLRVPPALPTPANGSFTIFFSNEKCYNYKQEKISIVILIFLSKSVSKLSLLFGEQCPLFLCWTLKIQIHFNEHVWTVTVCHVYVEITENWYVSNNELCWSEVFLSFEVFLFVTVKWTVFSYL